MKTFFTTLSLALLCTLVVPLAHAREDISKDFFYDNLEPYGSWRDVGDYGYCWQPNDVNEDWRPYSDGRWVYTDAGWTWDSDEPYGWAVYHYGRWANLDAIGWIWIPGTEWGPGWVSWRHSEQYVGWAPLPPEAIFLRNVGFSDWVDDYYDIGPSSYRFVQNRDLGSRRLRSVFIDQRQNITIIHQTTNITNITYRDDFVHNGGPRYDQQSRQSADPIHRYTLDRRQGFDGNGRNQPGDHFRSRIDGDSMSMMAIPFSDKTASQPRKVAQKLGNAEVNRGWKNAGTAEQIDEARARMKSKTRTPDALPPRAKFDQSGQKEGPRPDNSTPRRNDDPSKPKMDREDKPRRPDAPPAPTVKKPDPADRPNAPKEDPPKPKMDREDKPRRPDAPPSTPMKKPEPADRPNTPKEDSPKPKMDREDKPRRPDAPPSTPMKKPEPMDRPNTPKPDANREKPKQRSDDAPKPQQKPQQEQKPKPMPSKQQEQRPEQKRPEQKRPESKPDAQPAKKQQPSQDKPKGKGKPDEKDKDKNK